MAPFVAIVTKTFAFSDLFPPLFHLMFRYLIKANSQQMRKQLTFFFRESIKKIKDFVKATVEIVYAITSIKRRFY